MITVAVLGAATSLGQALLERLDADRRVTRILGLDTVEPDMPVGKLDARRADVRDTLLPAALDGVDAVVNLPTSALPDGDEDTAFALRVRGTRNVLEAVRRSGGRTVVHLSSGMVYGAQPDNEVPLDESAPLRAAPEFLPAYHHLLAEEAVAGWREQHPDVAVSVLRPAAILGPGIDDSVTRHLESPRLPLVRGHEPPLQVVHVDDVAAAVHLAVVRPLDGIYNVAADGWLSTREVCALLGRRPVMLPEEVAYALAARLWRAGLVTAPPGALAYLMYPWVLDSRRLHDQGWAPTRSNRDVLREFAAVHHGYLAMGRYRVKRRDVAVAAAAVTAGTVAYGAKMVTKRTSA